MNPLRLLIVDDEENMLHMLSTFLQKEGFSVITACNGREGVACLALHDFDCILCDLKMPEMDGLQFLEEARKRGSDAAIIMMSAYATVDTAVEAMKNGAYDFITKPFRIDEILCILAKVGEREHLKRENSRLKQEVEELRGRKGFHETVGESRAICAVLSLAGKVAQYDTTVLITGESGTGKELIARGIHQESSRSRQPLVSVNCGSIPANLLESEFFGHVRGAFTGADSNKKGLFEEADGGTLFLDEIGELPLTLQVKLLRVLQEHEFRPVGSSRIKKIDVRIIAATARNLEEDVERGAFRRDLLFRLNVVGLILPPLRDRKEDISLLCKHFITKLNARFEKKIERVSPDALAVLFRHDWPGNIRELQNVMERAVIYADGEEILVEHLPDKYRIPKIRSNSEVFSEIFSLKKAKRLMEISIINKVLNQTSGNKSQAASLLEISYPSLLSKLKEYDLK